MPAAALAGHARAAADRAAEWVHASRACATAAAADVGTTPDLDRQMLSQLQWHGRQYCRLQSWHRPPLNTACLASRLASSPLSYAWLASPLDEHCCCCTVQRACALRDCVSKHELGCTGSRQRSTASKRLRSLCMVVDRHPGRGRLSRSVSCPPFCHLLGSGDRPCLLERVLRPRGPDR